MRLFVGLMPPAEIIDELRVLTSDLREHAQGLRWTRPEQWHLTLAFLGEVEDDVMGELTRRLERAASRHPPLQLALGGGGRFGHRVLWAGVHGHREELRRLAASTQAAARRSRVPMELNPYRPHLTLARSGGETDLRPLVERLRRWQGAAWTVTRLHLVRSRLGAGPGSSALHEPITSWPLGG